MSTRPGKSITVEALARVEGEGGISVKIRKGVVTAATFRVYEPPRFFEAFLRGRSFTELPDLVARICGICPVAYQMTAVHALESLCGVTIPGAIRDLRRLLHCGEWIESHALHVALLHAPDFLGYESALQMAKDHPGVVTDALRLKKAGNALVATVGGREIHPVNVRVGGFWKAPSPDTLRALVPSITEARDLAFGLCRWVSGFEVPEFERDLPYVALRHPDEYPMNEGNVAATTGLDIPVSRYEEHFTEEHVPHSNALHSAMAGHGVYLVGPLARWALAADRLSPLAMEAAREAGLGGVCRNPFRSIAVRAVETVYACDEALRLIARYEPPVPPAVPVPPRAGIGCWATEAPRGLLYHRYRIDEKGIVREAKIVPPTSQNQKAIEEDLERFASAHLDLDTKTLTWRCEQVVRNYDPCISCATHLVTIDRAPQGTPDAVTESSP
ncbi:MAG: Ni/Fe hydrogenase subunit alpha [Thermoanaerobaculia bacterium]